MNYQALIKFKGEKKLRKLALPLNIGAGPSANILINSAEFANNSLYLTAGRDSAVLLDESGKLLSLDILKKHGIQVLGMVDKSRDNLLNRLMAMEKQALSNLSESVKDFLFIGGSSKTRYISYGALLVLAVVATSLGTNTNTVKVTENLSSLVHPINLSVVDNAIYGNFGRFTTNPDGVNYEFTVEDKVPGKLSFMTAGLDLKGELTIELNGSEIYQSKIKENCIDSGCSKLVRIDSDKFNVGSNTLKFIHKAPFSSYLVGKVKIEQLKEVDGALKNRIQMYLTEAESLYEQRGLGIVNLLKSKNLISKIEKIGKDFYLSTETLDKARSISFRVAESEEQFISEFWFTIDQKISLGKYRSALEDLEEMSKHFPDVTSEVGGKVIQYTKRVESFL